MEANSIRNESLPEAQANASIMLYHLLVSLCRDAALDRVINAGVLHGLEAWRLLTGRYEPRQRQRKASQLLGLMRWNFQGDILSKMESFEREMKSYERSLGPGNQIQDDLKIGMVMNGLPEGPVRTHLLLNSERLSTWQLYRDELVQVMRVFALAGGPEPMDVGAVGYEKKKVA